MRLKIYHGWRLGGGRGSRCRDKLLTKYGPSRCGEERSVLHCQFRFANNQMSSILCHGGPVFLGIRCMSGHLPSSSQQPSYKLLSIPRQLEAQSPRSTRIHLHDSRPLPTISVLVPWQPSCWKNYYHFPNVTVWLVGSVI